MKKLYAIKRKGTEQLVQDTPYWTGEGAFTSGIGSAQLHSDPVDAFNVLKSNQFESFGAKKGVEFFVVELCIEETEVIFDVIPKPSRSGGCIG